MKQLRATNNYDTLVKLAENNEFTSEDINEFVLVELGLINYFSKVNAHDDNSLLLDIIGGSIRVLVAIMDSKNISNETLVKICEDCLYDGLADYSHYKLLTNYSYYAG